MEISTPILQFINSNNDKEFDPYYLYDSETIINHCRLFRNIAYPNKAIHFASMANVNPHFLQLVRKENVNIFVNSIAHLDAALEAGFRGQDIIFTSSALSEKKMKYAEGYNVQLNVDSPNQLKQWLSLFPDKPIGIRCNIGDHVKPYSTRAGYFIGSESRLGFTREEITQIADKTKIKGLHLYVGTDIFDIDYFINCYRELVDISNDFQDLEYLNFGGGFGVSEDGKHTFDIGLYDQKVTELMKQVSAQKGKSIKLILEPGRIIGGDAGYFVCCVTDVKTRKGNQLIGLNASTVQFPRPLLYADTANHPVAIIRNGVLLQEENSHITTIFGCSTYSRDIFSNKKLLPEIQMGDIVVFGNAGSYSASSHMQFLGFPKPEEFFI